MNTISRLAISQSELFQDWPADCIERLVSAAESLKLSDGDILHSPGDPAHSLYLLATGAIRVSTQTVAGRSLTIRLSFAGDFHGLGPLISGAPYVFTAAARADTYIVSIPGALLMDMLRANGQLAISLFAMMNRRHRRMIALYTNATAHSMRSRIAALLGSLLAAATPLAGSEVQLSQDEIAQLLGSRRQVINRELRALQELGVIRLEYGRVVVVDSQALSGLSSGLTRLE
ncbi:MAG: Crp/Fnr family transcriptional regulator [Burkholderiaceae bacterium]